MASDPPHAKPYLLDPQGPKPLRSKVRIRFRKGGDLRLVSHHDLMKCFERMLRRAALPVARTRGFHPKPRMVFALSLALGIIGCQEVLELEFDEPLSPEEICTALSQQAPPGLGILSVEAIDVKRRAQPLWVRFALDVPTERHQGLNERIAAFLATSESWVVRQRPPARRIDIRPYVRDLRVAANRLEIDAWITPNGSVRPEEVVTQLGLGDLVTDGAIIERIRMELHDENQELCSLNRREMVRTQDTATRETSARPTALFPGPMSFDS